MKPLIGISMNYSDKKYVINEPYVKAIVEAGGIPYCIPFGIEEDAEQIIDLLDGLLLTGGVDIHPHYFGEEPHPKLGKVIQARDYNEMILIQAALKKKLPVFAICRGIQILNVALGGSLYQDIEAQYCTEPLLHKQNAARYETAHFIKIDKQSKLFEIVQSEKIAVNSLHHQAVKDVASSLKITAVSSDGIVEAAEMKDYPFCIAVQWHPEEMATAGDDCSKRLFQEFIKACITR